MIKTPFMQEPLYGMLESEMDVNGCWYHFFVVDEYIDVDLHYYTIGFMKGISVFDWMYPYDELIRNMEGTVRYYDQK